VSLDVEAEHVMAKSPQRDNVIRQLTKLGDTPYECVDFTIDNDFSFFIPSSQLTIIRREMVEKYQLESNLMDSKTTLPATSSSLPEPYSPTYLYNISNGKARVFYERQGLVSPATAFEIEQPKGEKLLMQCRHCIRYSLGYCVKRGGKQPIWHEPLYLRLSDGRRFRLAFDCHHCQMNVYAENH
jgi:putative protease